MKSNAHMIPFLGLVAVAMAGAANAQQEQVVKIGHSGPLSGPNAFAGKDNENGVRLAIEELNAKKITAGGKTLKFELVSEDDQCDAKSGVSVASLFCTENCASSVRTLSDIPGVATGARRSSRPR
jgi:ABC-type branched-subunit amino acid transport system substrate-binding protein